MKTRRAILIRTKVMELRVVVVAAVAELHYGIALFSCRFEIFSSASVAFYGVLRARLVLRVFLASI